MRNFFIILIVWVICSSQLLSQVDFEYTHSDSISSYRVSGAIELANGNYVISSSSHNAASETWDVIINVLNSEGDLLQSKEYRYPGYQLISTGLFVESDTSIILTALVQDASSLWVGHFSNAAEFISEELFDYDFPEIQLMNARKESDSTLVFTGWMDGYIPYAAKLNFISKTLDVVGYEDGFDICFDIMPRKDSVGYLILAGFELFLTDSDFQITQIIDKPMGYLHGNLLEGFNDSTYIYTSKMHYGSSDPDSVAFFVSEMNVDSLKVLKSQLLADTLSSVNNQTINVEAAPRKSIAQNEEAFFVGGVKPVQFPVTQPSKLVLGKFDSALNKLWEKDYGDDGMFYFMNGLIATSDGGCLMYGYRVKYAQSDLKELYVLKVGEDGLVTGETIVPIHKNFLAYPNPASDYIQFDLLQFSQIIILELIDMSGRVVLAQKINHHQRIDISTLPKGLYGCRLIDQYGDLIGTVKVLKE